MRSVEVEARASTEREMVIHGVCGRSDWSRPRLDEKRLRARRPGLADPSALRSVLNATGLVAPVARASRASRECRPAGLWVELVWVDSQDLSEAGERRAKPLIGDKYFACPREPRPTWRGARPAIRGRSTSVPA